MTTRVLIDGRHLSWHEFAEQLTALAATPLGQTQEGQVYAPRGCTGEARRLVRDLDLTDRIALLADTPRRSVRAARSEHRRTGDLVMAMRALFGVEGLGARGALHD